MIPVLDDITDVLLLVSTPDAMHPLWWICVSAMVVADMDMFGFCLPWWPRFLSFRYVCAWHI